MKTLYLLRHAKSSWDDANLADFDRPLNERGKTDAPKMGKRLKEKDIRPQMIYSSAAVRALSTAKLVASAIDYPENRILVDRTLYHADEEKLLAYLHQCSDEWDSIMLVGHNPGLTNFANDLTSESIDNIPTAGIVAISLKIDSWNDARPRNAALKFFDFPKNK